jgi:hypothetical protein
LALATGSVSTVANTGLADSDGPPFFATLHAPSKVIDAIKGIKRGKGTKRCIR